MTNPLLAEFATPFETAPFHLIKNEDFLPAIKEAILLAKSDISTIKSESSPTFDNTIAALDLSRNLTDGSLVFELIKDK